MKGSIVEILMDLVDLNHIVRIIMKMSVVEILMDLVDLNPYTLFQSLIFSCRDPYGSRGSKFSAIFRCFHNIRRDPYGSRGSKFIFFIPYTIYIGSRDPYGSRGSKSQLQASFATICQSRSLWISWI